MTHLTVVTINAGQSYTAQLSDRALVGEIARYLSHVEPNINAGTLELARVVRFDRLLRDVGYQSGDRLVIFTQSPRRADLPAPLRKGDRVLRFVSGSYSATSRGKRSLLLGKPDDTQQIIPDIDLRYFIPHHAHEFISRSCVQMTYDDSSRIWYASRVGQTRVMIDELELGMERVPLNDAQQIRFFRATDDVISARLPVGEMLVRVEAVYDNDATLAAPFIESGRYGFELRVGAEGEPQHLNASENLRVGQIVSSLAAHNRMTLSEETQVFHTRILPPDTQLNALVLETGAFLYTALGGFYTNNELRLRDVHAPSANAVYRVTAGLNDHESLIGCRLNVHTPDPTLDVDLYDATVNAGMSPTTRAMLARQARVFYRARENSWWIRLDEQARVPVFVNNHRVTTQTALSLVSGDVVSIGTSVNHYYLRLEIEIVTSG